MSRKLSILQIISKSSISSGGSRQAFQLARELAQRGHRVSFVCRPLLRSKEELDNSNITVVEIKMKSEFDLSSSMALYKLMKEEKTDVVHVHKGLAHSLAYPAACLAKVPVFVVNRGVSFPLDVFNRIKYKWKNVGRIIAVSEDVRQILIKSGKLDPDKVRVVYGGTDLALFDWRIKPDAVLAEFGISAGTTVIGNIANLRNWKGHDLLLHAARKVVDAHPNTLILIVGKEDDKAWARQLIKLRAELGLDDKVIFTGYRRDVPQLLAAMDFTVICSVSGEGLTGTLRESLAMKKPAISSDVGGNRELITHQHTGLLIPPNNHQALAEAMSYLIQHPEERRLMGEEGYKLIRQNFTTTTRISRLEELYYELLNDVEKKETIE